MPANKRPSDERVRQYIEECYKEKQKATPFEIMFIASLEGRIAALEWALGERESPVWDGT